METQESEVIDLCSPEPSPAVARRASHASASPIRRYQGEVSSPRRPVAPPNAQQDTCPSSPDDEWIDTSFLKQRTTRRQQPLPAAPQPLEEELSLGADALDPDDAEWRPSQQQQQPQPRRQPRSSRGASKAAVPGSAFQEPSAAPAPSASQGRSTRPKRTREEIAAEAAQRKASKALEAALRKEQREYDSDKHVLKYLTVLLDPSLMMMELGLKIADAFRKTQTAAEHERISYKVQSTGLVGFPAIIWTRKIPVTVGNNSSQINREGSFPDASLGPSSAAGGCSSSSLLQFEERVEPHIMVCFEADDFIQSVQSDQLRSLWSQLTTKFSGHRVHLMVHRLDGRLAQRERGEFRQNMRAGDGSAGFRRGPIDAFVSSLAVTRPGVTLRDVRVVDEGAAHACLITTAIAKSVVKRSDADLYLLAKGKKDSTSAAALLASHPIENPGAKVLMQSLCALPSVGPQIAHPIATKWRSLGALGTYLADPSKTVTEKQKELENMHRMGAQNRRVGPKAAEQIVKLLTCDNPDMLVHDDGASGGDGRR